MSKIIRIAGHSQVYLRVIKYVNYYDITKHMFGYENTPTVDLPQPWAYWPMDEVANPLVVNWQPSFWRYAAIGATGGRYYYAKFTFVQADNTESYPSLISSKMYMPADKAARIFWKPPWLGIIGGPTVGGNGGSYFQDSAWLLYYLNTIVKISGFNLQYGDYIDAIQPIYELTDGSSLTGLWRGGYGGTPITLTMDADEIVLGIGGRYGNYIDSLAVQSNKKIFPSYGAGGGGNVYYLSVPAEETWKSYDLIGFHGREGEYVDMLGFIYRSLSYDGSKATPANAIGWNLYVGTDPDDLHLVNDTPIALNAYYDEPVGGWVYDSITPSVTSDRIVRQDISGNSEDRDLYDEGTYPVSTAVGKIGNAVYFSGV